MTMTKGKNVEGLGKVLPALRGCMMDGCFFLSGCVVLENSFRKGHQLGSCSLSHCNRDLAQKKAKGVACCLVCHKLLLPRLSRYERGAENLP